MEETIIEKIDSNTARFIRPEKLMPEEVIEEITYEEKKARWIQAQESVDAQRLAFEAVIAPQQATADKFLADLKQMDEAGIVAKPVVKEVAEEIIKEEVIIKPLIK